MTTYIRKYDSLNQFARHCESLGNEWPENSGRSSQKSPSQDWDMGMAYEQALEMGLHGGNWEEGARQLQSVSIDRAAQSMADLMEPAIIHDVTGGGLDIGEYLSDSPECFFRLDEQEHTRPIVKIGVCAVPCSNISAGQMMNHGRAIIALVEALEIQQYSVELVAMFIAKEGKDTYREETTIKQAGQPWVPTTVAFALAHPASPRRLGFRALESDPDCNACTSEGYGNGHIKQPEGFDLYFPYLDKPDAVDTPERALKYVKAIAAKQQPDILTGGA